MQNIIFITLIGLVDNGKTTIFRELTHKEVPEQYAITQSLYVANKNLTENIKCVVFDTPGHEAFKNIRESVSNICNLLLWPVALNRIREKEFMELKKFIFSQKKNVIILLTNTDQMTEQKIISKLDELDIMPSYLGGKHDVFILKYNQYKYPEFFSIKQLYISELEQYIIDLSEFLYSETQLKSSFYVLDSIRNNYMGSMNLCISLGESKNKFFIGEKKISKIFDEEKKELSDIPSIGTVFYIKTDNLLNSGSIIEVTDKAQVVSTKEHTREFKFDNTIFLITDSNEKVPVLEKWCFDNKINLLFFIGRIEALQLMWIKKKNIKCYLFFSTMKNISEIRFFKTNSFYELIEEIEKDIFKENYIKFIEKIKEEAVATSKVTKIFSIPNQHNHNIGGNVLLSGMISKRQQQVIIMRKDKLINATDILSLKTKTEDLEVIENNKQEFGIICKNIFFEIQDKLFFLLSDYDVETKFLSK